MTDTATLITQLRILGQLTRTEAQVARQRVVQASTSAVRDDLRQNAAEADGRAARIADALRGLGALPDLVTPLLGRVAVLVRGATWPWNTICATGRVTSRRWLRPPTCLRCKRWPASSRPPTTRPCGG